LLLATLSFDEHFDRRSDWPKLLVDLFASPLLLAQLKVHLEHADFGRFGRSP
jgi:hypothetical protein